jgi:hypothetical protein
MCYHVTEVPNDVTLPGGLSVVSRWVADLYHARNGRVLWCVLDDKLRLALSQGWILDALDQVDDVLAASLSVEDSTSRHFDTMLDDLIVSWRSAYEMIREDFGVWCDTTFVGVDMELVVLTSPEHSGYHPAGAAIPAHSFITRLRGHEWKIAALARRLPVPGWPPTEETIPGLGI